MIRVFTLMYARIHLMRHAFYMLIWYHEVHRSVEMYNGFKIKFWPYLDIPTRTRCLMCSCGASFYRDVRTISEFKQLDVEIKFAKDKGWIKDPCWVREKE